VQAGGDNHFLLSAVFWILDILVRIRMRILVSIRYLLTNVSGSSSFLMIHLHHSSKIKIHKKSQKVKPKDFLHFLLVDRRIGIRTNKLSTYLDPGGGTETYGSFGKIIFYEIK
jgi:hypothetical protein